MEIEQQQKNATQEAFKELEAKHAAYVQQQTMDGNIIKRREGSLLNMKHQKVLWKIANRRIQVEWTAAQKTYNKTDETCKSLRYMLDNTEIDLQGPKDTQIRDISALQRIREDHRMAAKREHDRQIEIAKSNISNLLARIENRERNKAVAAKAKAKIASNLLITERNVEEQESTVEDLMKKMHDEVTALREQHEAMRAMNEQYLHVGGGLDKDLVLRNNAIGQYQRLLAGASITETKLKNELKSEDGSMSDEARKAEQEIADQEQIIKRLTSENRQLDQKYQAQCEALEFCQLEQQIFKDWSSQFRKINGRQRDKIAALTEAEKTLTAQKASLHKRFSQFAIKYYESDKRAAKVESTLKHEEQTDKKSYKNQEPTDMEDLARTSVDEAGYDADVPPSSSESPSSLAYKTSRGQLIKVR